MKKETVLRYFARYFASPILTVLVLIILELLRNYTDLTATAALAFIPLAVSAVAGAGMRSNIVSAVLIYAYTYWSDDWDFTRAMQVGVAALAIALAVGIINKRNRRIIEFELRMNGNYLRLVEALDKVRHLKNHWGDYTDMGRKNIIYDLEDLLGNMAGLIHGWLQIGREVKSYQQLVDKDVEQP